MNQQLAPQLSHLPPLASISDNLQYSDFPVIQKIHFYRASLRHTFLFFKLKIKRRLQIRKLTLKDSFYKGIGALVP
jgi:hypothetical protein